MKNRKSKLAVVLMLTVIASACGSNYNVEKAKEEIKGSLAEPMDASKAQTLKSLPDRAAAVLDADDQETLAKTVHDHLVNKLDLMKVGKMACHLFYLGKSTCSESRDKCLEDLGKLRTEGIRENLKKDEKGIKDYVEKRSLALPKEYVKAFAVLEHGLDNAQKVDCSSSSQQLEAAKAEVLAPIAVDFGKEGAERIYDLIVDLFSWGMSIEVPN